MSLRQMVAAAVVLAAALYLRLLLPAFGASFMPALRTVLAEDTVALRVPEEWFFWADWD